MDEICLVDESDTFNLKKISLAAFKSFLFSSLKTVNGVSLVGSGDITVSGSGGGVNNEVTFTTSGTFTVPAGVTKVFVSFAPSGGGGGGGGGGVWNSYNTRVSGGGGGAGGSTSFFQPMIKTVIPGEIISVIIGAGGNGGSGGLGVYQSTAQAGTIGANGGTTSFGTYISAIGSSGGAGGSGGAPTYGLTYGGAGGAAGGCNASFFYSNLSSSGVGSLGLGYNLGTASAIATGGTAGLTDSIGQNGENGYVGTTAATSRGGNGGNGANGKIVIYY